jgi:ribosome-binding ATPase YchF (GTP1/OBG family)
VVGVSLPKFQQNEAHVCRWCRGVLQFFTAGEKEVRCWTVLKGALAPQVRDLGAFPDFVT